MPVLGLSALEHDSAAALLSEDGIVAAIEESKLTRVASAGGFRALLSSSAWSPPLLCWFTPRSIFSASPW